MSIQSARAHYGLSADVTHDGVGAALTGSIGPSSTSFPLTNITTTNAVRFQIAVGVTVTMNLRTGAITGATTGTAQVETATVVAAAGATSSGNLAVTVTAAGVTGSPLAFSVALVTGVDTTASLIAAKIRTAFNANAALTALYTVGGTGADITLTRAGTPVANDTTLNIAITAGLGVSAIVSSTNTTAGVQPTLAYRIAGQTYDTEDFQGVAIGSASTIIKGFLIVHESGNTQITELDSGTDFAEHLSGSEVLLKFGDSNTNGTYALTTNYELVFYATPASAFTLYLLTSTGA